MPFLLYGIEESGSCVLGGVLLGFVSRTRSRSQAVDARNGAGHDLHRCGKADSAVRWRRNGAERKSCCWVLRLAVLCKAQPSPVLTAVWELFSCRSLRGEFCEPPHGGASARTAKAGFLRKPNTEQLIPTSQSALPPVAYSSLLRSLQTMCNGHFKVCDLASGAGSR